MDALPYPAGTPVHLRKLLQVENPVSESASWAEWEPGALNSAKSLPVAYEITGFMMREITVGEPMQVLRTCRNGIETIGLFSSSPVVEISDRSVTTFNSVYLIRILSAGEVPAAFGHLMPKTGLDESDGGVPDE